MKEGLKYKNRIIQLQRPLTAQEVFGMILDINITAINDLYNSSDIKKWELLLTNYNNNIDQVNFKILTLKHQFNIIKEKGLDNPESLQLLSGLDLRWFNQLRYTLYIMEEDLIINSPDAVRELWDMFFSIEKNNSFVSNTLNIIEIYEKM